MNVDRLHIIDKIKAEIDQYRPLPHHTMPMLKEYFRIGLTYSSNALEGNSLTEIETKVILEDGLTIGGKTMIEHLEAVGHSQAYDFMWNKARNVGFSEDDILALHRLFYYRIDQDNAGSYRNVPIFISGVDYQFPKPKELSLLMKKFLEDMKAEHNYHVVHHAALAHLHLVMIHPFIDGNGRTARLLMNLILLQHGYPITIIPPIKRSAYMTALKHANKSNYEPFLDFIVDMVYESSKEYLRLIKSSIPQ